MKSSQQILASRGFLEAGISLEKDLNLELLLTQLQHADPVTRSKAARLIGEQYIQNDTAAKQLIERLKIEKKLYTRLEICKALKKGNEETIRLMIPSINLIGNNQYRTIEEVKTSKKKSYPLPRDIIVRTIGSMGSFAATVLFDTTLQLDKRREIIDRLGYLIFYTPSLQTKDNFCKAKEWYKLYKEDSLFVWKFVTFCSAFPFAYTEEILTEIDVSRKEEIFRLELLRTRNLSQ